MLFSKQNIALKNTGLFSSLFEDYISQSNQVKPFYNFHFSKQDFSEYLSKNSFDYLNRTVLVKALQSQAKLVANTSSASLTHIQLLENNNTYTVTTGHQLCLFTGPLYFIYKIASTINLCKVLQANFTDKNFVPVYWMASEDHDFEEINHANVFGKKVIWSSEQNGSVGEFSTEGLQEVITELKAILGDNEKANELISVFEKAYLKHDNLANATRYLVNELFGEYGIVILDGNDTELKHLFKDEFKKDIFENTPYKLVSETINELQKNYSAQVTPREINIFYKEKGLRERIEKQGERFAVLNTEISFSKEELENIVQSSPEKLSPNVVLRPLYQQKILPNIAYVGGPGELAYWLEYKTMFDAFNIHLPILMPRNFVMLLDKGTQNKLQKLNLSIDDTFKDGEELVKQFIKTQHNDINLEEAKKQLADIFASITTTVSTIDKTLVGSTEAEKQKAINGITTIEQKINRALKQKSETDVNQIWSIKEKLFPKNTPQERYDNFSMNYGKYGKAFISNLVDTLTYDLEKFEYTVLKEN
ncbi:MAG TPA: bacillithiol biosynthesis cysteine-adding enzyme BshC [Bacteroidia bacterium]|nr:bacillithiol biosynthesis cysteine-adding enzyme BshC [Bacteroidia bacterium]